MYAIVLTYFDGSGICCMWGPYTNMALGEEAIERLKSWPIQWGGDFTIEPLREFMKSVV